MNRRSAGVYFLAIAAFLYATRYLATAIYGSSRPSGGSELYQEVLDYVGADLWVLSAIAAVVGIGYLVWAEVRDRPGQ